MADNNDYRRLLGERLAREVFGHMQTPEAVSLSTNPNVIGRFGQEIFVQMPGGDDSPRVFIQFFKELQLFRRQ